MKAALKTGEGTFDVWQAERPQLPGPDWVLARARGRNPRDRPQDWKKHETLAGHIVRHELAGEVIEVGAEVARVRPGDRVVIETVLVTANANGAGSSSTTSARTFTRCVPRACRAPTPNTSGILRTSSTCLRIT